MTATSLPSAEAEQDYDPRNWNVAIHIINGHSEVCLWPSFAVLLLVDSLFNWISIRPVSLPGDLASSETSRTIEISRAQGASFSTRVASAASTDFVWMAQARVTDKVTDVQRQSACSQTMSCSKYLISTDRMGSTPLTLYGNGTCLCTYVEDGDKSYLHHHTVSISKSSANAVLFSRRISIRKSLLR